MKPAHGGSGDPSIAPSPQWHDADLGRFPRKKSRSYSIKGYILTLSSVVVGALGIVALTMIGKAMDKDPDQYQDLPGIVDFAMTHRGWWSAMCLVPLALGLALFIPHSSPWTGRTLAFLGTICLGAIVFVVLMAFLALLTPLYQYQPI